MLEIPLERRPQPFHGGAPLRQLRGRLPELRFRGLQRPARGLHILHRVELVIFRRTQVAPGRVRFAPNREMLLHVRDCDGSRLQTFERRSARLHGSMELPDAPFRLLHLRPDPRDPGFQRLHGFPESGHLSAETLEFIFYLQDPVIDFLKGE